ncbi:hypothetical protein [Azospirillum argentinense]|uniref:hypothetical protein n=1 Tax=Azospirillum argentinense TaxID=2970906 RepID=UPI0018DBEC16|nr:hypothetical protein [Azospirillum argentinense]
MMRIGGCGRTRLNVDPSGGQRIDEQGRADPKDPLLDRQLGIQCRNRIRHIQQARLKNIYSAPFFQDISDILDPLAIGVGTISEVES